MNPQKIIAFCKSKHGMALLGVAAILIGLGGLSQMAGPDEKSKAEAKAKELVPLAKVVPAPNEQTVSYSAKMPYSPTSDSTLEARKAFNQKDSRGQLVAAGRGSSNTNVEQQSQAASADKKEEQRMAQLKALAAQRPSIQFLAMTPDASKNTSTPAYGTPGGPLVPDLESDDDYAPYGRFIRAELMTSVDSAQLSTPVMGLVTQSLCWNQKVLIPANSELHSIASPNRERDRIEVTGSWIVVLAKGGIYPEGTELTLEATALDMEYNPDADSYGPTDASSGLRGTVLNNQSGMDTIKLFAATFVAGIAGGLTETSESPTGGFAVKPTLKNGGLQGVQEVMESYAKRLEDMIKEEGSYVHVAAGKQFYCYVRQPILMSKGKLAGSFANTKLTASAANQKNQAQPDIYSLLQERLKASNTPPPQMPMPPSLGAQRSLSPTAQALSSSPNQARR